LKKLLVHALVLAFPDFGQQFILETDASGKGLGVILAQKQSLKQSDGSTQPIAYASRTIQQHEKKYSATELEALGVVWLVKHFQHYLYGHQCIVYTDHEPLRSLLNTSHPSGKLPQWGLALQEVDLVLHYRPSKTNGATDSLSRFPVVQPLQHNICVEESQPSVGGFNDCREGEDTDNISDLSFESEFDRLARIDYSMNPPGDSLVAAVSPQLQDNTKSGENTRDGQRKDAEIKMIVDFHENGILPDDGKKARELLMSREQYHLEDDILYYVAADKTLRLIKPTSDHLEKHMVGLLGHI